MIESVSAEASKDISLHQRVLSQMNVRHLANLFIFASVLVVLGVTLYPFDFTTDNFRIRFTSFVAQHATSVFLAKEDFTINVILFLPVGFSFAILASRSNLRFLAGLLSVTLAGAMLSLSVELLQLFLAFRYTSMADIAANTMGSFIGFLLYKVISPTVYRTLTKAVERGNRGHSAGWLATGYGVYLFFMLLGSLPLQESSLCYEFDKYSYPLVIGNEPTGARPWNGTMKDMMITRHALSRTGVVEYLANRPLPAEDSNLVVARYVFDRHGPFPDHQKLHLPLEWNQSRCDSADSISSNAADHVKLTSQCWLQTRGHVYELSSWIMETRRLSICATVASAGKKQLPDARILCVASDPYHQNLALVQVGDGLGIRIRSLTTGANGTNPRFIVPHVFNDTLMHRIVVALDASVLHVYIDSIERHYELELGPGFAMLHRFFPTNGRLDISSSIKDFHNLLFNAMFFIPLAYLLGLFVQQVQAGVFVRILLAAIGVIAPPLLLEHLLQLYIGREIIVNNLLSGFFFMSATVLATLFLPTLKLLRNVFSR